MAVPNLTRDDARTRAALLHVESYEVALDLTDGGGKPSDRTFRSVTTVRFTARSGESTFIDVIADRFHAVTLNGSEVDVSAYRPEDGITLSGLADDNVLVVDADLLYTNTGEGLHRFVDPLDGETYLYSQFETADAKRMFACFDQPDLKAAFTLSAVVPDHWESCSNGRVAEVEQLDAGKRVHFATTARISPYITALVAGPYHVVTDSHDGIDLGLWCRKTLAEHLDADELFTITKQGFDWYHANFGMRYAFDKYDQLFVPEFNAGAMENAGCVTFREDYVFRSKVTSARYERRAETILHEMAHMWFGDLVTMRWWDDLWLNESFATYASVLCQTSATKFTDSWATFANAEKTWAYRQDQLPSTHPIATDAPDVQTAEVNFDGITYAKGASVLKQLGAYVGVDAFLAGLREYFSDHAYGNTTLSDLLQALERSSGRDLGEWSKLWLETAGINMLRLEFEVDADGRFTTADIVQSAPDEVAVSNTLRPHRLAVGLYEQQGGALVRTHRVELDVSGARTPVAELIGREQPALLLVNDDDLTYCKQRLDDAQPRHAARRRHRPARVAAGPGAVLVGGVGHDPRRRAADARLRRPRRRRRRARERHRRDAVAHPSGAACAGDLRRPGLGPAGLRRARRRRPLRARGRRTGLGPPARLGAHPARLGPHRRADRLRPRAADRGHRHRGAGRRSRPALVDADDPRGARRSRRRRHPGRTRPGPVRGRA